MHALQLYNYIHMMTRLFQRQCEFLKVVVWQLKKSRCLVIQEYNHLYKFNCTAISLMILNIRVPKLNQNNPYWNNQLRDKKGRVLFQCHFLKVLCFGSIFSFAKYGRNERSWPELLHHRIPQSLPAQHSRSDNLIPSLISGSSRWLLSSQT